MEISKLIKENEELKKEIEEKNVAINKMSKDISRQLEEIDEKSTIIMAGAEKVKQLEKEIEELKKQNYEIVKELKPRVQIDDTEYIERNYISKDKIRGLLKSKDIELTGVISYRELEELLEEK